MTKNRELIHAHDYISLRLMAGLAIFFVLWEIVAWSERLLFPVVTEFAPVQVSVNNTLPGDAEITPPVDGEFRVFRSYHKHREVAGTFQLCWRCDNGFVSCRRPFDEQNKLGINDSNYVNKLPTNNPMDYVGAKQCVQTGTFIHDTFLTQHRYVTQPVIINLPE